MNLKFWKKDDVGLPDYSAKGLGLSSMSGLPPSQGTGLDLGAQFEPPGGAGMPGMSNNPFGPGASSGGAPGSSSYPPPQQFSNFSDHDEHAERPQSGPGMQKDLDLIVAKLDAIRAQLETLNARMSALEQRSQGPPAPDGTGPRRPWY